MLLPLCIILQTQILFQLILRYLHYTFYTFIKYDCKKSLKVARYVSYYLITYTDTL